MNLKQIITSLYFSLLFSLLIFQQCSAQDSLYQSQVKKLADLRANDIYSNLNFYKLNPKINYYGKNINQLVITVEDTVWEKSNSLNYYLWQKYITIRKADSLIIRITEKWRGTFEEW